MSLAIDVDKVVAVLLADGWHDVEDHSFSLDSYEYVWWPKGADDSQVVHGGGQSDVCATGFEFYESAFIKMAGPLTAILAVRFSDD